MKEMEELTQLIKDAKNALKKVTGKYLNYPAIINSERMLEALESFIRERQSIVVLREDIWEEYYLNVGLLASKALDFIPSREVYFYATCLHKIWYFLFPFNFSIFSSKQTLAYNFYKQHGYENERIASHFLGIDFCKPVYVKILLPDLRRIYQWKLEKEEKGDYFAESFQAKPD